MHVLSGFPGPTFRHTGTPQNCPDRGHHQPRGTCDKARQRAALPYSLIGRGQRRDLNSEPVFLPRLCPPRRVLQPAARQAVRGRGRGGLQVTLGKPQWQRQVAGKGIRGHHFTVPLGTTEVSGNSLCWRGRRAGKQRPGSRGREAGPEYGA